jgi:hypothetical protein
MFKNRDLGDVLFSGVILDVLVKEISITLKELGVLYTSVPSDGAM